MTNKFSKHLTYWLGVVAIGLIVGLSVQFVRAWTEPGAAPPGGNVGAPINTGSIFQRRFGPLEIQNDLYITNTTSDSSRLFLMPGAGNKYSFLKNESGTTKIFTQDSITPDITSAKVAIGNNGFVGIGTTNPAEMLEVYSETDADLDLTTIDDSSDDGVGNNSVIHVNRARGTAANPLAIGGPRADDNTITGLDAKGYDGNNKFILSSEIAMTVDGSVAASSVPGKIEFKTRPAGDTSSEPKIRMTIRNDGDVGIGTGDPQSTLHVPDGMYAQFQDNNAGAPPSADCDSDTERGRMSIDTTNNRLYICNGASRGWDYVSLTN